MIRIMSSPGQNTFWNRHFFWTKSSLGRRGPRVQQAAFQPEAFSSAHQSECFTEQWRGQLSVTVVLFLSCVWLCNPMDCSTPAQTHVHWVGDTIQSSYPLLPASPPALNLSQHQSLFLWVSVLLRWGAKSIGTSASAWVHPLNWGALFCA